MPEYTDVMVDLETTGISKDHNAIIQLAAVRFNVDTGEVDHHFFNECLSIPNNRYWNESTRTWWMQRPEALKNIFGKMRAPRVVMEEFYWWSQGATYRFWAKPLGFDFPFVESYFNEYGPGQAYPFYISRDMRSFIHGVTYPHVFDEKAIPFGGVEHDALFDALHQVKLVLAAVAQSRNPEACSLVLSHSP